MQVKMAILFVCAVSAALSAQEWQKHNLRAELAATQNKAMQYCVSKRYYIPAQHEACHNEIYGKAV